MKKTDFVENTGVEVLAEDGCKKRPPKDNPWKNSKLIIGAIILGILIIIAFVGQLFWDKTLVNVGSSPLNLPPVGNEYRDQIGNWAHPLGTDNSGRDILALVLVGLPHSLGIGFVSATIGLTIGIIFGFSAGYLGGRVDDVIRLLSDTTMNIPALLILIIIQSLIPNAGFFAMALLLAVFAWQSPTRVLRAQVLSMKHADYVKLAQLSGSPDHEIMFKEMMPNLMPFLISQLTAGTSYSVLILVGVEVLGLGSQKIPSLGITLNNAINASAILRGMWWWWGIPTIILIVVFMCLLLITVGLDEVSNPRLRDH
jgi:peptide/nickel transport system permease protein